MDEEKIEPLSEYPDEFRKFLVIYREQERSYRNVWKKYLNKDIKDSPEVLAKELKYFMKKDYRKYKKLLSVLLDMTMDYDLEKLVDELEDSVERREIKIENDEPFFRFKKAGLYSYEWRFNKSNYIKPVELENNNFGNDLEQSRKTIHSISDFSEDKDSTKPINKLTISNSLEGGLGIDTSIADGKKENAILVDSRDSIDTCINKTDALPSKNVWEILLDMNFTNHDIHEFIAERENNRIPVFLIKNGFRESSINNFKLKNNKYIYLEKKLESKRKDYDKHFNFFIKNISPNLYDYAILKSLITLEFEPKEILFLSRLKINNKNFRILERIFRELSRDGKHSVDDRLISRLIKKILFKKK